MSVNEKIIIFAGTSEGRKLSERLSSYGISHIVSVATDYGKSLLENSHYASVIDGRLDKPAMEEFFRSSGITVAVDATHPYAVEVTANLKLAAGNTGVKYLRLAREKLKIPAEAKIFHDNESCADHLAEEYRSGRLGKNILLTTGSKELPYYAEREELRDRLYVRIIPNEESFEICKREEIRSDHIIAMQGPFSEELNSAIIKEFDIDALVTKESGTAGGFGEKIRAAVKNDIMLCVIERPGEDGLDEESLNEDEICRLLMGLDRNADKNSRESCRCQIALIGTGPGEKDILTVRAERFIEEADYIIGAETIIADYNARIEKKAAYLAGEIIPYVIEVMNSADGDEVKIAILFSGDSGFYSGCGKCYKALNDAIASGGIDAEISVIPGISSVSYMSSLLGTSYDTAGVLSVHGRNRDEGLRELDEILRSKGRAFMLVSGDEDVRMTAEFLENNGLKDAVITAGCSLASEDESVIRMTVDKAKCFTFAGRILLYIVN